MILCLLPQGYLATSGYIFDYHNGRGRDELASGILRVEAKNAAQNPTRHRTDPTTKMYLAANVHSSEAALELKKV